MLADKYICLIHALKPSLDNVTLVQIIEELLPTTLSDSWCSERVDSVTYDWSSVCLFTQLLILLLKEYLFIYNKPRTKLQKQSK